MSDFCHVEGKRRLNCWALLQNRDWKSGPPMSSPAELSAAVKAAGVRLGFDLVGIAPAIAPTGLSRLHGWLERGYAADMHYIERRREAYGHPSGVLEGVRSVVMVALNYKPPADNCQAAEEDSSTGVPARVAAYARGTADYHDLLRVRLRELGAVLHALQPGCHTRGVVDTAPLLERDFARLAGIGWFGKNTMLIHKRLGSFFFLAGLLTDLELEPDEPHHTSHCGTCTRCLDVCPTDAFPEPGVLDARRCISYLTIERKGSIPEALRTGIGDWLFGCDLCQDVCPWNRKAPATSEPDLLPIRERSPADALRLLQTPDADLQPQVRGTPLSRPGLAGLKRNAALVLGNSGDARAVPVLRDGLSHPDPVVRGACVWALKQLQAEGLQTLLQSVLEMETDPDVLAEIREALASRVPFSSHPERHPPQEISHAHVDSQTHANYSGGESSEVDS